MAVTRQDTLAAMSLADAVTQAAKTKQAADL